MDYLTTRLAGLFLAIITTFISFSTLAQQNLVWYFGTDRTGLTFDNNGGAPVQNSGPANMMYEAMSVISDCEGNLVFYTDGINVYDKTHNVMSNGSGLIGPAESNGVTASALNGVTIISDPADTNKYYIFTIGETIGNGVNGFRYHTVDMNLAGNGSASNLLGEVTSKNTQIPGTGATAEMMAATGNECGDSVWVVAHSQTGSDFWAVPITAANGVGSLVVSNSNLALAGGDASRGSADFNANGNKLAMGVMLNGGANIYDFDFSTGMLSNQNKVNTGGFYGCEFSPDGEKAYFTNFTGGVITRYNLTTTTYDTVYNNIGPAGTVTFGDLEKGPDGKIYVGRWNTDSVLSVIDTPNAVTSATVGFKINGVSFGERTGPGLPQIYDFSGKGLMKAKIDVPFNLTQVCDKGGSLNLSVYPACGTWTGGAFINSNGVFDPSGLATPGTYRVIYSVDNCIIPDTVDFLVEDCCPPLQVRDTSICEGTPAFDVVNLLDTGIGSWALTAFPSGTGVPATFSNPIFDASNYATGGPYVTDGQYQLTYTYWNAPLPLCPDSAVATISVDSFPRDIFNGMYQNPIQHCGKSYTFYAKQGLSYSWQPNVSTVDTALVTNSGKYFLTVSSPGEQCLTQDSVEITLDTMPIINVNFTDTNVCDINSVTIGIAQSGLSYSWSPGGQTTQDISVTSAGNYVVTVLSSAAGFCPAKDSTLVATDITSNAGIDNDSILICQNGTVNINANQSGLHYSWTPGGGSTQQITVNSAGTYKVTVLSGPQGFCPVEDSIRVVLDPYPQAGISTKDTLVCGAGSVVIGVDQSGYHYAWSHTNDNTQNVTITNPGTYYVDIFTHANGACPTKDTVEVNLAPPFAVDFIDMGDDTTLCPKLDTVVVGVNSNPLFATYNWSMGNVLGDTAVWISDFQDGDLVILSILDAQGCDGADTLELKKFCSVKLPKLPNVFTPNGDGTNENILPINYPKGEYELLIAESEFVIYNRWGRKLHSTNEYPTWDGTIGNSNAAPGIYYYILSYVDVNGEAGKINGFFHLVK